MMMEKEKSFKHYKGPAGGWGALAAGGKMILKEKAIKETTQALLRVNQPKGFDCPGCAWPDPQNSSIVEFCENGVKAVAAETTSKRADHLFFAKNAVSFLRRQSAFWLEDQGRLTEPMSYNPGNDRYEPISWHDAFQKIGTTLKGLDDPNQAIFYTSGRTSNEAAFLYQLFGRQFGTNNFPDCSNMCHESSGVALKETIGVGKGTVSLEDFQQADTILIFGQNPGTNHPRMLSTLQACQERGATIITFNPLIEKGLQRFLHPQQILPMIQQKSTPISSLYFQPLIGGDLAVLTGVIKELLEAESQDPGQVLDHDFIRDHTIGLEELQQDIQNTSWDLIVAESGLNREQIHQVAEIYRNAKAVIACWAMGVTQHKYAVPTIQYISNLLLLRGNVGKPGAGVCPVRGHSNVQGDRTVGITEKPTESFLQSLEKVFEFKAPHQPGYNTVQAIQAMAEGKAKVFIGMGGNFASATPDTDYTEKALASCELTVHISTKLNRSHLVHGKAALILPCLGRTETDIQQKRPQGVTVEDSMSVVHLSYGNKKPASSHLLSEPAIVAGIAQATLNSSTDWEWLIGDYGRIREKIEAVLPDFVHYNERIQNPRGFVLRNPARYREWHTSSKKAQLTSFPLSSIALPEGQLRLMTIRSHDQYNTTIYGLDDRYRGIYGTRKVILMNAEDMVAYQVTQGDQVNLTSHSDDGKLRTVHTFYVVTYQIPKGCAAAYFPETNGLVSIESIADKSSTPVSKFIPITIQKCS